LIQIDITRHIYMTAHSPGLIQIDITGHIYMTAHSPGLIQTVQ